MTDKVVVIFVEGDTEEEFYKVLLASLRQKCGGRFLCNIVLKNVKGVGNYKSKVSRIFEKRIKKDYPDCLYDIILCYDTDVFEFAKKPPIDWPEVIRELKYKGAYRVSRVQARKSIEDWFLYDYEGLRTYLKLSKKINMTAYTGTKGLEYLFHKANRTYIKGTRCDGLVKALDIEVILSHIYNEIHAICEAVGLNCLSEKICKQNHLPPLLHPGIRLPQM